VADPRGRRLRDPIGGVRPIGYSRGRLRYISLIGAIAPVSDP
jgi:hypothetical protein